MTPIIPDAALLQHVIALGKTGAGKSSVMRYLVEHLHDLERPICIIDPKGDWWGIKSAADGKRPGLPFVIFGGEHADVPINEHSGAAVAELVATGNRPTLIDLGGWMVGERTRFFIAFASTLFKLTRGQRYLVIDEIHNFAPQGKIHDPDAGKMLHWANRLASEGRGKGITILAASQRPQKCHKDFVTSCETLVAMRVIHKLDRDAIKDWIDGCGDPARGREVLAGLAGMKRGSAWVWSPEIEFGPELVHFPMFRTYDSFKPQAANAGPLKGWADVDLQEVRERMQTSIAQAEANDPKMLRKRIADLEAQLSTRRPEEADHASLDLARRNGYNEALQELHGLQGLEARRTHDVLMEAAKSLSSAAIEIERNSPTWPLPKDARPENPDAVALPPRMAMARSEPLAQAQGNGASPVPARARQIDARASSQIGKGGKYRIMVVLAQRGCALQQRRLGLLAGMSTRSGTWSDYLSALRSAGFIEGREEVAITPAGFEALGDFPPLPTGDELIEYWRRELGGGGKRAIFDALVKAHPRALSQDDLGTTTGLSVRSGTWSDYLSALRGLGLIEGRGELRASEDLFR